MSWHGQDPRQIVNCYTDHMYGTNSNPGHMPEYLYTCLVSRHVYEEFGA